MEIRDKLIKIVGFSYSTFFINRALGLFFITITYYKVDRNFLGIWIFIFASIGYFKYAWEALSQSFVKDFSMEYTNNDQKGLMRVFKGSLLIVLLAALFSVLALFIFNFVLMKYFLFAQNHLDVLHTIFNLVAVYIFIAYLTVPMQALMAAKQKTEIVHLMESGQALLNVLSSVMVVLFYPSLSRIVVLYAIIQIIILSIYFYYERDFCLEIWRDKFILPPLRVITNQISFSLYLLMLSLSVILLFQVDVSLIGFYLPASLVAVYGICQKIYNLPMELSQRVATGVLPATSYLDSQNKSDSISELFMRTTKYSMIIYFSVGLPIFIYAYPLLANWFGAGFAATGALVLNILLFHQWFNINHCVGIYVLKGMGKVKELLTYSWVCAIFNFILSFVLIHKYGLVGVAIGTTVPFIIFETYIMRNLLKHLRLEWRQYFNRVFYPIYWPVFSVLLFYGLFLNVRIFNLFSTLTGLGLTGVGLLALYFARLNKDEKKPIIQLISAVGSGWLVRSPLANMIKYGKS